MADIQSGRKVSHWIWYIIPTPPYPGASSINQYYAIQSDEAAHAYLTWTDSHGRRILRDNYFDMMQAVAEKLEDGMSLSELVGPVDSPKVRSSVEYFTKICQDQKPEDRDTELLEVLERIKPLMGSTPPRRSLLGPSSYPGF